jgi:hypothetical protein
MMYEDVVGKRGAMRRLFGTLALVFMVVPSLAAADTRLLMGEEQGCFWCARWNAEVGGEYHLTAEGKAAPLLRTDVRDPLPKGVTLARPMYYTPTFVLLVDGVEVSRIEGYPGEDFFWGLLDQMLKASGAPYDSTGS